MGFDPDPNLNPNPNPNSNPNPNPNPNQVTEGFRLRDPEHEEQMRAAVAKARAAGTTAA